MFQVRRLWSAEAIPRGCFRSEFLTDQIGLGLTYSSPLWFLFGLTFFRILNI